MKQIRKIEVNALRESGLGRYVHKTFSSHPKYYVVESEKALTFLDKYRESIKVK